MCTPAFVCLILEHKCTVNYTVREIFGIPISFDRRHRDIVNKQHVRFPSGASRDVDVTKSEERRGNQWEKGISQESNFVPTIVHAWRIPLFTRNSSSSWSQHRLLLYSYRLKDSPLGASLPF